MVIKNRIHLKKYLDKPNNYEYQKTLLRTICAMQ
jgi:hypothetical protein